MLPSNERLTRAQCFSLLSNTNLLVVFNRLGTLKYLPSSTIGLSVITGSKQEKKAVARNKLRRRLYSIFSKQLVKNLTGMVYVSKHAYSMSFDELTTLFNDLLAKTQKTAR